MMATTDVDPLDVLNLADPQRPNSLLEAFANTARSLQLFGVERIRVVGLSHGCDAPGPASDDGSVRAVTEIEFMREFVFHSRPCVILDAVEDWPAMKKWRSDRYLFDLDHQLPLVPQRHRRADVGDDDEPNTNAGHDEEEEEEEEESENDEVETGELGPIKVTVALTPNGRADAVTRVIYSRNSVPDDARLKVFDGHDAQKQMVPLAKHAAMEGASVDETLIMEKVFMYAAEIKVTLPELFELLSRSPTCPPPHPIEVDMRTLTSPTAPVITYAQLQNNCLNTEYSHLHGDLGSNVEAFGTRVFGSAPEAGNVWFGIPASVSSMHQDWVENLYPVIRGVKEFTLIPPWEGVFVPKPEIPSAGFVLDKSRCDRENLEFAFAPYPAKDGTVVPWMDFDFTPCLLEEGGKEAVLQALQASIAENRVGLPRDDKESSLKTLHPLVVNVQPGETLYLPAMWLHRVAQHADSQDIRIRARHHAAADESKENEDAPHCLWLLR